MNNAACWRAEPAQCCIMLCCRPAVELVGLDAGDIPLSLNPLWLDSAQMLKPAAQPPPVVAVDIPSG